MANDTGPGAALKTPVLAGLAGAVTALGQAPFGWALPGFAALIVLLGMLGAERLTPRRAALLGWLAGLGYFATALHWIVEPFLIEPELYGWLAPFGLIGLAGGLALFWAAALWAAQRAGGGVWRVAIALALAELARGHVFTGFPWALVGYTWSETVLAQWAALIGPYGLTLLTLLMAALPVWLWTRLRAAPMVLRAGAALGLSGGLGLACLFVAVSLAARDLPAAPDAPILRLVQPNAPQDQKWDPDMIPVFFNRMVAYSAAPGDPDLIIWPESAVPVLLEDAAPTLGYISDEAGQVPLVLGIQRSEGDDFYNSATLVDASGQSVQVYDKHHLVPFGEYMPFPAFWQRLGITGLAARVDTGYSAGPGPQIMDLGVATAIPLICYEAVFPAYARTAPRPDMLLQLTNDAWFGKFSGPYQHLAQARMRAIESGLPMVRVANTGVSAVIDAKGRITHALPLGEAGFVDAPLPPALPATPYAQMGEWPTGLLLFFLAVAAIWPLSRNRH
ncbi:apolipoprotein N-acyltransferase [Primorskyibacter aestuariivivens]|uniref:apolipoprotein N-acyltransferase n=1 Tax=Primorskyibacter aestuariivivens TaxID=1888912 RepID=UPI00230112D2|nr:apolipoprotein N-acyltransferase [Primorskyibacter aestuariivivens]MDA7430030.1 apolipoprotein N-acyltransferase [Primorskyibacter aestuariivivens]